METATIRSPRCTEEYNEGGVKKIGIKAPLRIGKPTATSEPVLRGGALFPSFPGTSNLFLLFTVMCK